MSSHTLSYFILKPRYYYNYYFAAGSVSIGNRSKMSYSLQHILFSKSCTECLICACHFARCWRYCDKVNDQDSCPQGSCRLDEETLQPVPMWCDSRYDRSTDCYKITQEGLLTSPQHHQKLLGTVAILPLTWRLCPHPIFISVSRTRLWWRHMNLIPIWSFKTLRYKKTVQGTVPPFLGGSLDVFKPTCYWK